MQVEPPPAIQEPLFLDPLAALGALAGPIPCPTGAGVGEFVGDGFILKVAGRCYPDGLPGIITPSLQTPQFTDGEVSLDFKVVNGPALADVRLIFRDSSSRSYQLSLVPTTGTLSLAGVYDGGDVATLSFVQVQPSVIRQDEWNTLAVRANGAKFWVAVNQKLVIVTEDPAARLATGGIRFGITRLDDIESTDETAVVFRNLRVSEISN